MNNNESKVRKELKTINELVNCFYSSDSLVRDIIKKGILNYDSKETRILKILLEDDLEESHLITNPILAIFGAFMETNLSEKDNYMYKEYLSFMEKHKDVVPYTLQEFVVRLNKGI